MSPSRKREGKAAGVWFPDLPGCISAGDTLDEAMSNAAEALALWIDAAITNGRPIPAPRTELKRDPETAEEMARYVIALVPLQPLRHAAGLVTPPPSPCGAPATVGEFQPDIGSRGVWLDSQGARRALLFALQRWIASIGNAPIS